MGGIRITKWKTAVLGCKEYRDPRDSLGMTLRARNLSHKDLSPYVHVRGYLRKEFFFQHIPGQTGMIRRLLLLSLHLAFPDKKRHRNEIAIRFPRGHFPITFHPCDEEESTICL